MEFRHTERDAPVEISLDHFCEMVRAGKVKPDALYREPWTHGEWLTVDNLWPFHKHSLTAYPLGQRLIAEQHRREQEAHFRALADSYSNGALIEEFFHVRPLAELVAKPENLGASRLFILPSFESERLVTVIFRIDELRLEAAVAPGSIWASLPRQGRRMLPSGEWPEIAGRPSDPGRALRMHKRLNYAKAPHTFTSWDHFAARCRDTGDSSTRALDGVSYRHQLFDNGKLIDVRWFNANPDEHSAQVKIIGAYAALLRAIGWQRLMR